MPLGSQISAEEEAFLISLGWQAADSADEGDPLPSLTGSFDKEVKHSRTKRRGPDRGGDCGIPERYGGRGEEAIPFKPDIRQWHSQGSLAAKHNAVAQELMLAGVGFSLGRL